MKPWELPDWELYATAQAKDAIFTWLLAGGIYQLMVGRLVSLPTLILFIPGLFVASLAQIPVAIVDSLKDKRLVEMKAGVRAKRSIELLLWTLWRWFTSWWSAALAIGAAHFVDSWL